MLVHVGNLLGAGSRVLVADDPNMVLLDLTCFNPLAMLVLRPWWHSGRHQLHDPTF
jgi:hypothetical protein